MSTLLDDIASLGEALASRNWMMATAESCTGGLISSTLTDVSGSSRWFKGAVVAYHNDIKENVLGVPLAALMEHGAVSEPVVRAMTKGVCALHQCEVSVAVSGVAGPTGGTAAKPVGMVWIAWRMADQTWAEVHQFSGNRAEIKQQTVAAAVQGLLAKLKDSDK